MQLLDHRIAVIGLGYLGLPLAALFCTAVRLVISWVHYPPSRKAQITNQYDAIFLSVADTKFLRIDRYLNLKDNEVVYYIKGIANMTDAKL